MGDCEFQFLPALYFPMTISTIARPNTKAKAKMDTPTIIPSRIPIGEYGKVKPKAMKMTTPSPRIMVRSAPSCWCFLRGVSDSCRV